MFDRISAICSACRAGCAAIMISVSAHVTGPTISGWSVIMRRRSPVQFSTQRTTSARVASKQPTLRQVSYRPVGCACSGASMRRAAIRGKHRNLAFATPLLKWLIGMCSLRAIASADIAPSLPYAPRNPESTTPREGLRTAVASSTPASASTQRVATSLQFAQNLELFRLFHLDQTFIPKQLFWLRATVRVNCRRARCYR